MTEIAAFVIGVAIGWQFRMVKLEACVVGIRHEAHIVEDEEFSFWTDEHGVADTRGLQIGFGLLCDAARIAVVRLACAWIENVANDRHRWCGEEWINLGC